jgi:hypothetical protein
LNFTPQCSNLTDNVAAINEVCIIKGTPTGVGTRSQGVLKVVAFKDCAATACAGPDPEDTAATSGGHGVHTASTVAGNSLTPPLNVAGLDLKWPISGVAPCARVITYKVCGSNNCDGAATQAAINQSIVDQVDVVNFSISVGTNPWSENDRA